MFFVHLFVLSGGRARQTFKQAHLLARAFAPPLVDVAARGRASAHHHRSHEPDFYHHLSSSFSLQSFDLYNIIWISLYLLAARCILVESCSFNSGLAASVVVLLPDKPQTPLNMKIA